MKIGNNEDAFASLFDFHQGTMVFDQETKVEHSKTISVTTTLVARGSHISLMCMSIICIYASMNLNIFVCSIKSNLM
jgi:hypothetical protein